MQPQPDRIEYLQSRLNALATDRQELRARHAAKPELERNRLEIVRHQTLLSRALVRRYA